MSMPDFQQICLIFGCVTDRTVDRDNAPILVLGNGLPLRVVSGIHDFGMRSLPGFHIVTNIHTKTVEIL